MLTSTNISDADRRKYDSVMGKFDEHFKVRKNVIYERARFNRRDQKEGESAEEYITALYGLIETCEYGALKEEMLRDRLIVGIRDTALSERLQLNAELTLDKTKKAIRQKEAVKEPGQELKGEATHKEHLAVEDMTRKPATQPGRRGGATYQNGRPQHTGGGHSQAQCGRCGRRKHQGGQRCPAQNVVCHRCKKRGHFKAQCHSKVPAARSTDEVEIEEAVFLGALTSGSESSWFSTVCLEHKEVRFKLDTGAEVTAITEATYQKMRGKRLRRATIPIYGAASNRLKVLGQFRGKLSHKELSHQEIYVVQGLKNNLLGLIAISALQLVRRVEEAHTSPVDIKKQFPKVFTGLGNLGEEYSIKLWEDAKPHALFTPRNVPIPLREKVREELIRMENMGVISKVTEPTPWCAGMVAVPKKVRSCPYLRGPQSTE